jgi:peptidoglycan/LPS O-acetylase OafA/YrhL
MEIRKLNMLRGIAALIVVVSHYSNSTNILHGILGHGAGQIGVMIFFILSGFLMSYLYMDTAFNRNEIATFMIARIASDLLP